MSTESAIALSALADVLPPCDAMNLGYAMKVDGAFSAEDMHRALGAVLRADPLLDRPWQWQAGGVESESFATLAAQHLAAPLSREFPTRAALWSSSATHHLFLFAVHHAFADGVVLGRLANDLSRTLVRNTIEPVTVASGRALRPADFSATLDHLVSARPSVRASCRNMTLPADLTERFRRMMRSWRTTPFAGAVACVAAAVAAVTERTQVTIGIQMAARKSVQSLRAAGPWYDHASLQVDVEPFEPLRAILLEVSERVVGTLATAGVWESGRSEEALPDVLVAFDEHPLAALSIEGCRVTPVGVDRHPRRADGTREYLVATEADIVVVFRDDAGAIGISVFTKTACIASGTTQLLLDAIAGAVRAMCYEGERPLDPFELTDGNSGDATVVWPQPQLLHEPLVDAVSPVFHVRRDTLDAFANDARQTLASWGKPPWLAAK
ncbi:MAG: hypothetical protein WB973_04595 [Thermoanaerobaculia bacterium]